MTTFPAIFPSDNIWNVNISALPLAAGNGSFQASLGGAACPFGIAIQLPWVAVPSTQANVAIHLGTFAASSDPGPSPIPSTAPVESNSDHHVLVVQLGTNKLYELYHAVLQGDLSWNADQQSIYDLTGNALRTSGWTSADAAGLPMFAGVLRYSEVVAGYIGHALRIVVGNGLTDNAQVWPARHHQTSVHNAAYPPMGQRFRLKASTDISGFDPRLQVVLQCMKSFGCMVSDMSGSALAFKLTSDKDPGWATTPISALAALSTNDFEAVDVSSLMLSADSGQTRGGPLFTVTGLSYPVHEGSLMIATKIDERSRFTGTLVDASNTAVMPKGQRVAASDQTLGTTLFSGFIRQSTPSPLIPQPLSYWTLDCPDLTQLAERRSFTRVYPTPVPAGKIAVDLVHDVLGVEGVQAAYAARTESSVNDFVQGTLTSVVAAKSVGDGDLELSSSNSVQDTYNGQLKWQTGTLTNVQANAAGDLSLPGVVRNWNDGNKSGQTLYGNGSPTDSISNGQYLLSCTKQSETRSRLDFAGTWQDSTIEVDVALGADVPKTGFTWRTTAWTNGDGSFAYAVELSPTQVELRVGTNGGSNSSSSLGVYTFSPKLAYGTYRLRVDVSGSGFIVYINDVARLGATDFTYSAAGYIALRNRDGDTVSVVNHFDNFGVMAALSGTWVSPGQALGAVTAISSTHISWDTSLSSGGTILVETSVDNGSTYQTATNGGNIPGLTVGGSGAGKTFKIRVTLSTSTTATLPDIRNLQWSVLGGATASGTRTTVPPATLDADTFTRANQAGWGTASGGSVWRQDSGAGTIAIASNKGTVAGASTYNYMPLGVGIAADLDLKVRVSVGASTNDFAAILARYQDNGNFYRLNIGNGNILIDKFIGGVQTVLLEGNTTTTAGVAYWMRFQLIGSALNGKKWLDGSGEPATWDLQLLDTTYTQGAFGLYGNPTTGASITFDSFTVIPAGVLPGLDLTPVGRCGSSFIGWNAILPPNTTLGVDVSLNGSTWVDVTLQNGGPIPLFKATPDPTVDIFNTDTSANYVSTNGLGGSTGAWTINTAQSRVEATGGAFAMYLNGAISWADIDMLADTDMCDVGGLVWRYTDPNNYYLLQLSDASGGLVMPPYRARAFGSTLILSGSIAANGATLYKVASGVITQLATTSIAFTRGTYHRFRVTMLGGVITASMDGVQLFTYTDSSPLAAGQCGLYNSDGGSGSRYYQLWIAPQGDDLTGLTLYTRQRLATTDSTVSPQLLDITAAAFGQNIGVGAILPGASYDHAYGSAVLDDLVQKSGDYVWTIQPVSPYAGQLLFKKRVSIPAPWILQPNDSLVQDVAPVYVADDYSNRQVLKGVIGTGTFSNSFTGDSKKTSFNLSYKVAPGTVPAIKLNGSQQSIGMKGTSGFSWYYAEGETDIAQDTNGVVLTSSDTLIVAYTGTFDTSVTRDNLAGQAAMAAREVNTTGIVEAVTDVSQVNMDVPTAQALGDQLNARYGILGRQLACSTTRAGLLAGQTIPAFFPTRQWQNVQLLISSIDIGIRTYRKADGTPGSRYVYAIQATESANPKSWQKRLAAATKKV